jgi:hypothetical protein
LDKAGKVLVAGAGGFIGGHLVADLLRAGYLDIRVADCEPLSEWHQVFPQVENLCADLRELSVCRAATCGARYVFNTAADMGGMGFIETHKADCMLSVIINTHMLMARATLRLSASSTALPPAFMRQTSRPALTCFRFARATPTRQCPRTAMAGKSCSANGCVAIPRGLRVADADCPVPQCLRSARHF